jgi:hypothetical protein
MQSRAGRILVMLAATAILAAQASATGFRTTPAEYSRAVSRICTGALLFNGTHSIGTRAGAVAVSKDIRATGRRRLRRVDAVPKPVASARLARRWIATERALVARYAWAYVQIWDAIERADTPAERNALPAKLVGLLHSPDKLQARAAALELALRVPDCTGGQPTNDQQVAAGREP